VSVLNRPLRKVTKLLTGLLIADLKTGNPSLSSAELELTARRALFALLLVKFAAQQEIPAASSYRLLKNAAARDFFKEALLPVLKACTQALGSNFFLQPFDSSRQFSDKALHSVIHELFTFKGQIAFETLAYLYEKLSNALDHKKEGVFYTPLPIVRRVVRESVGDLLQRSPANHKISILDPACGSGIFLLQAARLLTDHYNARSFSAKLALLRQCIFGVDKDPQAAAMTRLLLTLYAYEDRQLDLFPTEAPDFSGNIRCGNSLLEPEALRATHFKKDNYQGGLGAFSWNEAYPNIMEKGGFDCIIGNPPYGLSRGGQLSPAENELLKDLYRDYRRGKVNKYLAFMARGYRLLNSSGIMSFIVPNAWLGIRGGAALRKLFLLDKSLHSITVFRCRVFEEPGVEAVIFKVDKGQKNNYIKIRHADSIAEDAAAKQVKLPVIVCKKSPDFQIPLNWSKETRSVLDQIEAGGSRLGDPTSPFIPAIALQAYAVGKGNPPQTREQVREHIYHRQSKEDQCYHPYLEGADIRRYHISWSGQYLRWGPWLAEPQELARFSGPRLVVREVLNQPPYLLNAAFLEETVLYNKSVLHIRSKKQSDKEALLALLVIINSKLSSFVIRNRGRKSQRRLFPKIVNDDLKDFPLPAEFPSHVKKLSQLAKQMTAAVEKAANALPSALALVWQGNSKPESQVLSDILALQQEIDGAVYTAFGLKTSHVQTLERDIARPH